jgi:TPR repeat protein
MMNHTLHPKHSSVAQHRTVSDGVREYNQSLLKLDSDEEEAFRLNAIAASKGMHDAVLAMGWFYLNGCGVEADLEEAISWFKKSARQGEPRSLFSLGQIAFDRGDFAEALQWLNMAIAKGHSRSKYYLGKLYWRGQEVVQDRKTARRLFSEAAADNVRAARRVERYLSYLGSNKSIAR